MSLEAVAEYSWYVAEHIRETDRQHMAECDDPGCDALCCIAAREGRDVTKVRRERWAGR